MIGQRINNYEIVAQIGEGGMGAVYLARHPFIDRQAAVKVLRPGLAGDPSLVTRFFNEARAANAIRHPNIIDVIDVGMLPEGGTPYLMMELLEGENLSSRLKRVGRLAAGDAIDLIGQTASALGAAHAKGIVHRDLKPENLFLVPDPGRPGRDRVKVLDFGIAKLRGTLSAGAVRTQTGALMGTPPYMSPEQCRGVSADVDHRTDVYALGIILYEMLCGAPPFVAEGFGEMLVMHLTRAPEPPRARNPGIPPALEAAILRALAKSPEERFASMDELRTAVEASVAGLERTASSAPPPAPTLSALPRPTTTLTAAAGELDEIAAAPGRRRAILAAAGAAALAGAIALAVGLGRGGAPPVPEARPAGPVPVEPAQAAAARPPPDAGAASSPPPAAAAPKKPPRRAAARAREATPSMEKW